MRAAPLGGLKVVCVDHMLTGSPENVAHLQSNGDFDRVEGDVTVRFKRPGRLEEVYHFASPASPKDFLRIPLEILK